MTQTVSKSTPQTSKKVRALLAGGLVLGVGAAITLAAWTDQEWAEGIFGAGSFNIQSSVDGTEFFDHESQDDAATLSFELTGADNMSPNDIVAAPFVLRLDTDTTYDAEVALTSAAITPVDAVNAQHLTYGIIQVDNAAACTPEATGTEIATAGAQLGTVGTSTAFQLAAGAADEPGAAVTLCFQVTAGPELIQGQTTEATWEFVGTSTDDA